MNRSIKELLLAAYKSSNMELAEFGKLFPNETGVVPLPTIEKEVTPFIRQRTELYRLSWLVLPLKEALDKLGFEEERKKIDAEIVNDPRTWSNKDKEIE